MAPDASGPDRFVAWLDGSPMSRDLVGGKASSVSRLASLGAPVPVAFALTTRAHDEFTATNGLPRRVAEITMDDLPRVRDTIMSAPLPASIASALVRGYRTFAERMGADVSLAVRSSGTAEDSAAFSFAGLHDTVLDVRTLPALERAVRQCWASLWSDRAVAYRLDRGMAEEASDIAVVVQQLVRSDVSFIAFTSDPVTHDSGRVVIDAAWGLGESIVSGLVVPDHITIGDDGHVLDYIVGDKHLMVIPGDGPEFGTREVPVPRALRKHPVLTHEQAREIARLAHDLSRKLDFEADLEGGIAGGVIHLFQARPITTLETSPIAME